jgi:hypothetical protein
MKGLMRAIPIRLNRLGPLASAATFPAFSTWLLTQEPYHGRVLTFKIARRRTAP